MNDDEAPSRAIGRRLKTLRLERRKSLQTVASALGITYQQVQKYETGQNRISASTLFRAAGVLDVDVALFFDELNWPTETSDSYGLTQQDDLAVALSRIEDAEVRRRLAALISLLGQNA